MNDWKTKDVIAWILDRMGHKVLVLDAQNEVNLELYIRYIKHKYSHNKEVQEFINYFL